MRTLVLGLEHFIDKIGYQAAEYARRGVPVRYLVRDESGLSSKMAESYGADVRIVPDGPLARIRFTLAQFLRGAAAYCELYDIGRLTVVYALIAVAFGSRLIVILRGGELCGKRKGFRRMGLVFALRLSHRIVAKEFKFCKISNEWVYARKKSALSGIACHCPERRRPRYVIVQSTSCFSTRFGNGETCRH